MMGRQTINGPAALNNLQNPAALGRLMMQQQQAGDRLSIVGRLDPSGHSITIIGEYRRGEYRVIQVTVESQDGEITSSDLGIPVKTTMDETVAGIIALAESGGDFVGIDRVRDVQRRLRRRSMTDDLLREVAEVHRAAEQAGAPSIVRAVADRFTISYSSAERWVRQARSRGFLPPAERGAR
jgi:hypothetical protein